MTVPICAQKGSYRHRVEAGRRYFWCAFGRSGKQPLCDGSHSQTNIKPIMYNAPETGYVWFCGCKSSGAKPRCDGTHKTL